MSQSPSIPFGIAFPGLYVIRIPAQHCCSKAVIQTTDFIVAPYGMWHDKSKLLVGKDYLHSPQHQPWRAPYACASVRERIVSEDQYVTVLWTAHMSRSCSP